MSELNSSGLSERELEILRLVATGASNKEIAQQLYISANTVKVHLRNIFNKIDATSRTEAAMYAVTIGLVHPLPNSENTIDSPDNTQSFVLSSTEIVKKNNREQWLRRGYVASLGVLIVIIFAIGMQILRNSSSNPSAASQSPMPSSLEQWKNLATLPTGRIGLGAVTNENQIFTFGGETNEGVSGVSESLDIQSLVWSKIAAKPVPVADINAASIGGVIYIPGGKLSSGDPTKTMEIYEPNSNTWFPGPPLPKAISGYGLVTYEGKLYLFGGWDGSNYLDDVYMYDPDLEEWFSKTSMPTARAFAGVVVVGDSIYVIGGYNGNQALNTNEVYYPNLDIDENNSWDSSVPIPIGRYAMGITTIADSIYLIGGEGPIEPYSVLVFSPLQSEWGQLDAPIPQQWSMLKSVTVGTRLFAMGGTSEDGLVNQVWSYQVIFINSLPIIHE